MKNTRSNFLILFLFFFYFSINAQTVSSGQLNISFVNTANTGVRISSIRDGATEILNNTVTNRIFTLFVRNTTNDTDATISSLSDWGSASVVLTNGGTDAIITFSNPTNANLPNTLGAIVNIHTNGSKSEWDLSVTGLGNSHSLMDVNFPQLNINGNGGQFLIPQFSGRLIPNPASGINYNGVYPRGWRSSMQFLAYYGANADVYFGFHDPAANFKVFRVTDQSGGVNLNGQFVIPNRTLTNNDWNFPGHFALDLFDGDWYDAAMIYKDWASTSANYWPNDSPERQARQAHIGRIGAWFSSDGYYRGARTIANIQREMQRFVNYMPNVPLGVHYYAWNGKPLDDDFPELFPELDGTATMISELQTNNDLYVMPYINGRLYDSSLASFDDDGLPSSVKNENGDYEFQDFDNSDGEENHFAVMCPSQDDWQTINVDASAQLTDDLGMAAIYLDQVCAASSLLCMDASHGHPLGGGSYWRDGYKEMFEEIHTGIAAEKFVTVEGGTDYLIDEVDGFLTDGWLGQNQVPAFQAVYSGKVQLFGTRSGTGSYNDPSFYTKHAQSFAHGIQPGRFFAYMALDPNAAATAAPFARQIATLRTKLAPFMAFGEMKYPIAITAINPNPIPDISSTWVGSRVVTISALQRSVWQRGDSVAVVMVNASMTDALEFSYDFDASQYNIDGDLLVREVTETSDGNQVVVNNSFTQTVTLAPMEAKAYVMSSTTPLPISLLSFTGKKLGEDVELNWTTLSEVDFDGFEIQRSNGSSNWDKLGFVSGSGDSIEENTYQYLDANPYPGLNYYRLKAVDLDGSISYSKVIIISFVKEKIRVFPNPTTGEVFIDTKGIEIEKVMIYNQLGQVIVSAIAVNNTLNISHLPKGVYIVEIKSQNAFHKEMIVLK